MSVSASAVGRSPAAPADGSGRARSGAASASASGSVHSRHGSTSRSCRVDESAQSSVLSADPPHLASVLTHLGSNRAFAIFVQEQTNAAAPAEPDGSDPFAPAPELHNNGIPGMRIGCGRAGCVDVHFYYAAWSWRQTARALESGGRYARRTTPQPAPPRTPRTPRGITSSSFSVLPTTPDSLQPHLESAGDIFTRYLLLPYQHSTGADAYYPPLHIAVSSETIDSIQSHLTRAHSSHSLLPSRLFDPLLRPVFDYLDATFFGLFLNTLAFDHLEVEAMLLGDEQRNFIRSAHGCYKEEYALFVVDYESVRQLVEEGPEAAPDGPPESNEQRGRRHHRDSSSLTTWFLRVFAQIDAIYRTYFRSYAEYAIYLDPQARAALVDSMRTTRRRGRIELALLNALLSIKDYAVEVLQYDVLPAYRADALRGHRRQRRASIVAQEAEDARSDATMLLPVLQTPLVSPLVADDDDLDLADLSLDGATTTRRASIVHAAVDVPLGARRSSNAASRPSIGGQTRTAAGSPIARTDSSATPTPVDTAADGPLGSEEVALANETTSSRPPHHSSGDVDHDADDPSADRDHEHDLPDSCRGPVPSTHPLLRSMSDLRARRSIVGAGPPTIDTTVSPMVVATIEGDPLDDVVGGTRRSDDLEPLPPPSPLSQQSQQPPHQASPPPGALSSDALSIRCRSVLSVAPPPAAIRPAEELPEVTFCFTDPGPFVPPPSRSAVVVTSILKAKIRYETLQDALRRIFFERLGESDRHLPTLQAGGLLVKYTTAGKPSDRWFKVSAAGDELCWGKVDEKTKAPLKSGLFNRKKRYAIADIIRVRYGGGNSRRLAKYHRSAKNRPWLAWSVTLTDKTMDLVCAREQDVQTWVLGLQSLAPLSTSYMSRAAFRWRRVVMKVRYYAMWQAIEPILFIEDLIGAARDDVPFGRLPTTSVVELLDSQIVAMPDA